MFRFAQPEFLYVLPVLLAVAALFAWSVVWHKRSWKKLGNPAFLAQWSPEVSASRAYVKFGLLLAAMLLLVVAAARPQFGQQKETVQMQGIELVVAMDVSNSMLAQDIKPSRLERAKQIFARLLEQTANDRVGLVVFAGDAFTQMPITADYASAAMFLSALSPDLVARQGTAIGAAIERSIASFDAESDTGKAILLITDGENHEDDAVSQATRAAAQGVKVIVVGIGSVEGAPVPMSAGSSEFRKDRQGRVVVSKLNEAMCREIAQAGDGIYLRANAATVKSIQDELKKLDKANLLSKNYKEQAAPLLWIALLLLLADFVVLERKSRLSKRLFGGKFVSLSSEKQSKK